MMSTATQSPPPRPGYRSVFSSDEEIRAHLDGLVGDLDPQVREALEAYVMGLLKQGRSFEARLHVLLRQRFGSSSEAIPGLQLLLFSLGAAKADEEYPPDSDKTVVPTPEQLLLQALDRELAALLAEAKEKELAARRLEQAKRRSLLNPVLADNEDSAWDGLERRVTHAAVPGPCDKCGLVHDIIDVESSGGILTTRQVQLTVTAENAVVLGPT